MLFVRCLPQNVENTVRTRGIENLLNSAVFEERFYRVETTDVAGGDTKTLRQLDKTALCNHLCIDERDAANFAAFLQPLAGLKNLLTDNIEDKRVIG